MPGEDGACFGEPKASVPSTNTKKKRRTAMRLFSTVMATVLTLMALGYGYNRPRQGVVSGQEGVGRREGISGRATRVFAEIPKGTAIAEGLPEGVEGVVMEEGVVKIQPGYKFVKKNNKVTVMSKSAGTGAGGRLGVGGSWSCVCKQGDGGCSTMVEDNQIFCAPGGDPGCSDKCVLSVVIKASKSEIVRY